MSRVVSDASGGGSAGFTLLEVLAGLALLSAAALIVMPMTRASVRSQALATAANDLAAAARSARASSVRAGAERSLLIDVDARSYWSDAASRPRTMPARIAIEIETPTSETRPGPVQRIRFLAGGGSSGARILLRDGVRTAVVSIDWLTGHSHVER